LVGLTSAVVSGTAVAASLGAAGVLAVAAAFVDVRTRRIPNSVVVAIAAWLVVGAALAVVLDHRSVAETGGDVTAGWLLSGAPLVALIWVVRPAAIGGGDLKLLSLLACVVGLLAPYAAGLLVLSAVIVALAQATTSRSRNVALGPGLALGYAVAVAAGVAANNVLGGRYS
jgi:leader peptidase (prepilin peptidase)/N-methyltransferase